MSRNRTTSDRISSGIAVVSFLLVMGVAAAVQATEELPSADPAEPAGATAVQSRGGSQSKSKQTPTREQKKAAKEAKRIKKAGEKAQAKAKKQAAKKRAEDQKSEDAERNADLASLKKVSKKKQSSSYGKLPEFLPDEPGESSTGPSHTRQRAGSQAAALLAPNAESSDGTTKDQRAAKLKEIKKQTKRIQGQNNLVAQSTRANLALDGAKQAGGALGSVAANAATGGLSGTLKTGAQLANVAKKARDLTADEQPDLEHIADNSAQGKAKRALKGEAQDRAMEVVEAVVPFAGTAKNTVEGAAKMASAATRPETEFVRDANKRAKPIPDAIAKNFSELEKLESDPNLGPQERVAVAEQRRKLEKRRKGFVEGQQGREESGTQALLNKRLNSSNQAVDSGNVSDDE